MTRKEKVRKEKGRKEEREWSACSLNRWRRRERKGR